MHTIRLEASNILTNESFPLLAPCLFQFQQALDSVSDAFLEVDVLPAGAAEDLQATAGVPSRWVNAFREELVRYAFHHSLPQLREPLPDDVDYELGRDLACNQKDSLPGGRRFCHGDDMGAGNITDVDLVNVGYTVSAFRWNLHPEGHVERPMKGSRNGAYEMVEGELDIFNICVSAVYEVVNRELD